MQLVVVERRGQLANELEQRRHRPRSEVDDRVEFVDPVDRGGLKAALLALTLDSLVLAGTREKVRVHAHIDEMPVIQARPTHGALVE